MDRLTLSTIEPELRSRVALVGPDRSARTFGELAEEVAGRPAPPFEAFVATPTVDAVLRVHAHLEHGVPFFPTHPKWLVADADALAARARSAADAGELHRGTAVLLATSGSSGPSKLACVTRENLLASARAHERNLPFLPGDRWLLALPFAHAGGLSILTRCLAARSTVVLSASFDATDVLERIEQDRVTLLSVVPTVLERLVLADHRGALARLRAVLVGGAAFPARLRDLARDHGVRALPSYGLTETISQVSTASLDRTHRAHAADSGRPLEGVEVDIDAPSGVTRAEGVEGEILVRGAVVFAGYVGGPARSPSAPLHTGDRGRFDAHGNLVVVGRIDDVIVTGGENVHPAEVEAEAAKHDGVREVVVFGLPDESWGHVVAAAFVLSPGARVEELVSRINERLPTFRRIRRSFVLDALPTNAMGKVSRRDVKAVILEPPDR